MSTLTAKGLRAPKRPHPPILLMYTTDQEDKARTLANWCDLCRVDEPKTMPTPYLYLDYKGLGLCMPGNKRLFRLSDQKLHQRGAGARKSELAQACGAIRGELKILDACAGFGTDGLLLAMLGCEVTLVERNCLIWLLLRDFAQSFDRVEVLSADCKTVLVADTVWDVVYLDPMFPQRKKNALPNLGLQNLRYLTQSDESIVDLEQLVCLGLTKANNRVVVKRRIKDPLEKGVDFQVKGKSIRFDVYLKI